VAKNLKLKLARVELEMTQGDLAEAVGCHSADYRLDRSWQVQSFAFTLPIHLQVLRENAGSIILGGRR